jgi:hypothetical protein
MSMKLIARICLASAVVGFALFLFTPGIAQASNFAGTWAVSGALGDPVIATTAPVCVFKQDGNKISGSCKGPNALGSAEGAIDDNIIVWHWDRIATNEAQVDGTVTFGGKLGSDGVIRGEWKDSAAPDDAVGTITAQKVK